MTENKKLSEFKKAETEIQELYDQCQEVQQKLGATYHLGLLKALDIIRKYSRKIN